jgi:putative Holliday junction resolvase
VGRILAIDVGKKRTGIAVTDSLKLIANGLTTVATHELIDFLTKYIKSEEVDLFVIGMPTQMNNQPSEAVKWVQPVVNRIKKVFANIPVELVDERFTSKIAHQTMIDGGLKKMDRQNKSLVDTISATIILQSYMESVDLKKFHRND